MKALVRVVSCLAATLLVTSAVTAQPQRVEIGGRRGPDPTVDWPRPLTRAGMSDAERIASFEAFLGELSKKELFAGAALVARDGKPVFRKAYGLANREFGVANTPETKFNIGSINKTFTRDAIMLLAKEGKLTPGDTIAKHLTSYKGAGADTITIAQLPRARVGDGRHLRRALPEDAARLAA